MVTPHAIREYIQAVVNCIYIEIDGDGHHFEAIIVSTAFHGLNRIKRHQLIYQALGDRMREEIHALSMKTYTEEEWATLKTLS